MRLGSQAPVGTAVAVCVCVVEQVHFPDEPCEEPFLPPPHPQPHPHPQPQLPLMPPQLHLPLLGVACFSGATMRDCCSSYSMVMHHFCCASLQVSGGVGRSGAQL